MRAGSAEAGRGTIADRPVEAVRVEDLGREVVDDLPALNATAPLLVDHEREALAGRVALADIAERGLADAGAGIPRPRAGRRVDRATAERERERAPLEEGRRQRRAERDVTHGGPGRERRRGRWRDGRRRHVAGRRLGREARRRIGGGRRRRRGLARRRRRRLAHLSQRLFTGSGIVPNVTEIVRFDP